MMYFNKIAYLYTFVFLFILIACEDSDTVSVSIDTADQDTSVIPRPDATNDAQQPEDASITDATSTHDADSPDVSHDADMTDAEVIDADMLDAEIEEDAATYEPPDVTIISNTGRYMQLSFPSAALNSAREVVVYLPENYHWESNRYPVLYMHDGQNLFRDNLATYGTEWQVDETVDSWSEMGRIPSMIVVGIYSNEQRIYDYTPSRDEQFGDGGGAEAYAHFLIDELKPYIDYKLRTLPELENTGLIGSSLGGLVSLYILAHHPGVFGRIGALSNSLFWNNEEGLGWADAIAENLVEGTRLWIDGGSAESDEEGDDPDGDGLNMVLDESRRLIDALLDRGLTYNDRIAYFEDVGGVHNEATWAQRLPSVLSFLFGAPETPQSFHLHLYGTPYVGQKVAWGNTAACSTRTLYWPTRLLSNVRSSDEQRFRVEGDHIIGVQAGSARLSASLNTMSQSLDITVQRPVNITFSVQVPESTPTDATVYVAGGPDELGAWSEAMFPLQQGADGRWTNTLTLLPRESFEFKITRGSWETVEKDAYGQELENRTASALSDGQIDCKVERWADQ